MTLLHGEKWERRIAIKLSRRAAQLFLSAARGVCEMIHNLTAQRLSTIMRSLEGLENTAHFANECESGAPYHRPSPGGLLGLGGA